MPSRLDELHLETELRPLHGNFGPNDGNDSGTRKIEITMPSKIPGNVDRTFKFVHGPSVSDVSSSDAAPNEHLPALGKALGIKTESTTTTKRPRVTNPEHASSSRDAGPPSPIVEARTRAASSVPIEAEGPPKKKRALQVCRLAGAKIADTSVEQLQQLIRNSTDQDRPNWNLLARAVATDTMGAIESPEDNSSGRFRTFKCTAEFPDKRLMVHATAAPQPDGTMRLVSAGFKDLTNRTTPTSGIREAQASLRTTGRGWLGGDEIDAGSMRQLRRALRKEPETESLQLLADLVSDGQLVPSKHNQPGQKQQFAFIIDRPDGNKELLGVATPARSGATVQLSGLVVKGKLSKQVVLNNEATDEQARFEELKQSVIAAGFGSATQRAYDDTAKFLNKWMHRTDRGGVLDVAGNVPELLHAVQAYAGENSYVGLNAECVLKALAGDAVRAAPRPRTVDPVRPTWMANPLGLSPSELMTFKYQDGGDKTLAVIEEDWEELLELFGRATIVRLAENNRSATPLRLLIQHTREWRHAGFDDKEIVRIFDIGDVAATIRVIHELIPAVREGRLKKTQIMVAIGQAKRPKSRAALKGLLEQAERGPKQDLALKDPIGTGSFHLASLPTQVTTQPDVPMDLSEANPRKASLGGRLVDAASMRQLSRLARKEPDVQFLKSVADSISNGLMVASSKNQPGQPQTFATVRALSDGSRELLGATAIVRADSTLQLSEIVFKGKSLQRRVLNSEEMDEQAQIDKLNRSVVEAGFGPPVQQAYKDTLEFLSFWMRKSGRGCVLDVPGNVAVLLTALHAYVGESSYFGRNAKCVMEALDGKPVGDAPRPRTLDAHRPDWMDDPLGLSEGEKLPIKCLRGASHTFREISLSWKPLLQLFDRAVILNLANNISAGPTLKLLSEVTPAWREAGFSDKQIIEIADYGEVAPLIRDINERIDAIKQGRITTGQVMTAACRSNLQAARNAVKQLSEAHWSEG